MDHGELRRANSNLCDYGLYADVWASKRFEQLRKEYPTNEIWRGSFSPPNTLIHLSKL